MGFGDRGDDGQAQPGAGGGTRALALAPAEWFEQGPTAAASTTGPVLVTTSSAPILVGAVRRSTDPPGVVVLQCVLHQVAFDQGLASLRRQSHLVDGGLDLLGTRCGLGVEHVDGGPGDGHRRPELMRGVGHEPALAIDVEDFDVEDVGGVDLSKFKNADGSPVDFVCERTFTERD